MLNLFIILLYYKCNFNKFNNMVDIQLIKQIFPEANIRLNKVGNVNIYLNDDEWFTLGYSFTGNYWWIRKTKMKQYFASDWPVTMQPYFVKSEWKERQVFPLHYNKRTDNYGFENQIDMINYFIKYCKKFRPNNFKIVDYYENLL